MKFIASIFNLFMALTAIEQLCLIECLLWQFTIITGKHSVQILYANTNKTKSL